MTITFNWTFYSRMNRFGLNRNERAQANQSSIELNCLFQTHLDLLRLMKLTQQREQHVTKSVLHAVQRIGTNQLSLKMKRQTLRLTKSLEVKQIEPQANVSPSGEIQVNNQSINPENPAQDHTLEPNSNSKSIEDGGCLISNVYEDQVTDYY